MTERVTVCVFAKPPAAGRVKTRLAAAVGAEAAAQLARAFLHDTWSSLVDCPWVRPILSTTERGGHGLVAAEEWLQGDGDLGDRLERILRRALAEARFAMAIGSDTPGLPIALLEQARQALEGGADAALGPSDDGGFYLIALSRCPERLLADLPWSADDTFARTRARLESCGLGTVILPTWSDVDRPADLDRLRSLLETGAIAAPRTARLLAAAPRLSVIIPVLDEEKRITQQLESVRALPSVHEVIVVDGGSNDRTVELCRAVPEVSVLVSGRGRARQMNTGAAAATGDVLLFLHADVELPPGATGCIRDTLTDPAVVAGAFRTWTQSDRRSWLSPLLHLADLRSRYTRLPYGDQAMFVRAEAFRRVGGYPEQPLMEDLELSRRLRRLGEIRVAKASVRVSGRRFLARPVFYTLLVNVLPLLYRVGVPARQLARLYANVR